MKKQRAINLMILLVLLALLPTIAYLTYSDNNNDTCTIHCQRVIHNTAWNECMLQCLKEQEK